MLDIFDFFKVIDTPPISNEPIIPTGDGGHFQLLIHKNNR